MAAAAASLVLWAGVALAIGLSLWSLRLSARARRAAATQPLPRRGVEAGERALQHVGVIRFNPYHDTGGDYSFAVALLDAGGDGVLVTGLYHRDRCRVYAKPVAGWTSKYTLTEEEVEAVERARSRR